MTDADDAPDVDGWVTGIASGDGAAAAAVARYFAPRVRAMLRARLQPDAVDAVTRDTLVSVLHAARTGQLREPDRLPGSVHGVARSLATDHVHGEGGRAAPALDGDVVRRLVGTAPSDDDRRRLVARGLEALASADREVLQLTLVDGLRPREIAQRLSLTADVVRRRRTRALERLLAIVDPTGRAASDEGGRGARMECPTEAGRDVAEAYVAGTLPDAEQDAFEQHFFTCAACLARVQMLQEVRDRLASVPAAPRAADPRWQAAPWLGLALAAGLVAAVSWWWQGAARPADSAQPSPSLDSPVEAPGRRAVLAQLAAIVPPRYVPLAGRGGETPAAGSFDAAMTHYVAGRHDQAAGALQVLSEERPTDPGIAFFWGISELVVGHHDDAREGLTRAIAAGVQPYADEAHFYLAKVYLAEGNVDLAKMELRYALEHEAGPDGEAQRLLQALDRLPA